MSRLLSGRGPGELSERRHYNTDSEPEDERDKRCLYEDQRCENWDSDGRCPFTGRCLFRHVGPPAHRELEFEAKRPPLWVRFMTEYRARKWYDALRTFDRWYDAWKPRGPKHAEAKEVTRISSAFLYRALVCTVKACDDWGRALDTLLPELDQRRAHPVWALHFARAVCHANTVVFYHGGGWQLLDDDYTPATACATALRYVQLVLQQRDAPHAAHDAARAFVDACAHVTSAGRTFQSVWDTKHCDVAAIDAARPHFIRVLLRAAKRLRRAFNEDVCGYALDDGDHPNGTYRYAPAAAGAAAAGAAAAGAAAAAAAGSAAAAAAAGAGERAGAAAAAAALPLARRARAHADDSEESSFAADDSDDESDLPSDAEAEAEAEAKAPADRNATASPRPVASACASAAADAPALKRARHHQHARPDDDDDVYVPLRLHDDGAAATVAGPPVGAAAAAAAAATRAASSSSSSAASAGSSPARPAHNRPAAAAAAASAAAPADASSSAPLLVDFTVAEVGAWLRARFGDACGYDRAFAANAVDGATLTELTDEHLKRLGVSNEFHRLRIIANVKRATATGVFARFRATGAVHDSASVAAAGRAAAAAAAAAPSASAASKKRPHSAV